MLFTLFKNYFNLLCQSISAVKSDALWTTALTSEFLYFIILHQDQFLISIISDGERFLLDYITLLYILKISNGLLFVFGESSLKL